ncbi:hypothetical protein [Streptomyces sp. NPDC051561]|uniref:hypothetical protein n=1 Tax=Streptomyces sp. NPDC051561 TaxID=3365658 RepID=UPI0037B8C2AE
MAVTAALPVLRADSIRSAGQAVEWLTDRVAATGRPLYAGALSGLGGSASPVLEAALRCSRELRLLPVTRLRRRTTAHSTHPPANRDARASGVPTALWPAWDLRLSLRHPNGRPVARRADEILTVACLLAGSTTPTAAVKQLTGTTVSNHNVSTLLADLTRHDDCTDVLHALILLANRSTRTAHPSTTHADGPCSPPAPASLTLGPGTICSAACARTSGRVPRMPSAGSSRP